MGVQNLWKALDKGGAVQKLEGSSSGHHAQIVEAVENKVVAVDLSTWLMQAQTQPALLANFDSSYACAVKVVFDRTIHWLRYGCLPVFVIEGQTPAAKLDKLRARCVAQYGPSSATYDVGNRAGGQFDRLGQAVKRLLDALGVPCVQAVGEGEAMCAALNVCGWAHAVQTADADALLFGALTVYKHMQLQIDNPQKTELTRCCIADVRRVLGISRGGDAALMAVAHLAGGDYDMGGADNVGEALALQAVRQLLSGCEDDEVVLQKLEAAIARGPLPELDALTHCTGCKACGHEGGRKSKIKNHSAKNGCTACGCEDGCVARQWTQCECAFHTRADERLLNRVVRRAVVTPNFMAGFKTAASAYAQQTRQAISSIQREYSLPNPDSRNVFSWQHRPDVRAVSDIMCKYIKDWDYRQVRLKLLPLLLEWDVRQGPSPAPAVRSLVQFRPIAISKVSSKGMEASGPAAAAGGSHRQQHGWRYVLQVDRLAGGTQQQQQPAAAAGGSGGGGSLGGSGGATGAAAGGSATAEQEAEDLAIDQTWIAGTARSRLPKQDPSAAAAAAGGGGGGGSSQGGVPIGFDLLGNDDSYDSYGSQPLLATQMPPGSQAGLGFGSSPMSARAFSSSQAPAAAAAAGSQGGSQQGGGSGGSKQRGTLQFADHRAVRCSLIDNVWPHLTTAFRERATSGGRAKSGGTSKKKQAAAAAAASGGGASAVGGDKQRTVKDFFGVVKDYTASGRQSSRLPAAAGGGAIPGLVGLTGPARPAGVVAAAATPAAAAAAAAAAADNGVFGASDRPAPQQSFMEWLDQQQEHDQQLEQQPSSTLPFQQPTVQQHPPPLQQQQHPQQPQQQQHLLRAQQQHQQHQQQQQQKGGSVRRGYAGMQSTQGGAAAGSGSSRARKKQTAAKTPCKSGPLDRFLRPAAAAAADVSSTQRHSQEAQDWPGNNSQQQRTQILQQQQQLSDAEDYDSPEVPSLAARLAAKQVSAAAAGHRAAAPAWDPAATSYKDSPRRPRADTGDMGASPTAAAAVGGGSSSSPWQAPPAKKASNPLAKELLGSPARLAAAAGDASGSPVGYYATYDALLQQMGVASPEQQQQQQGYDARSQPGSRRAVKGLFTPGGGQQEQAGSRQPHSGLQLQQGMQPECIELLDSPLPSPAVGTPHTTRSDLDIVDLTKT